MGGISKSQPLPSRDPTPTNSQGSRAGRSNLLPPPTRAWCRVPGWHGRGAPFWSPRHVGRGASGTNGPWLWPRETKLCPSMAPCWGLPPTPGAGLSPTSSLHPGHHQPPDHRSSQGHHAAFQSLPWAELRLLPRCLQHPGSLERLHAGGRSWLLTRSLSQSSLESMRVFWQGWWTPQK